MTGLGEVNADLVGPAGLQATAHVGRRPTAFAQHLDRLDLGRRAARVARRAAFGRSRARPPGAAQAIAAVLEKEGVAFDIANHRDAPASFRIWTGATIERADVEALIPWVEWAFETLIAELATKAK